MFSQLKSDRNIYSKRSDLLTWEGLLFHSLHIASPLKKRLSETSIVFQCELTQEGRKPLSELTNKGLRHGLRPIFDFNSSVAQSEDVNPIEIATYVLKLYGGEARNYEMINFYQQLIEHATFEIGKRKYTKMRKLCKPESIVFPPYNILSDYRVLEIYSHLIFLQFKIQMTSILVSEFLIDPS
ncbi:hypothetical protein LOD99_5631 [Oopsacas minuta]|uniref:Uncharacterized protein n=1 Tax=Oopsacas minuta TaxID=111878 RepID=A0AAV7JRE3_9METZ|nr:hypothetical protein LOD99_5631 [Oopsacas minuta]